MNTHARILVTGSRHFGTGARKDQDTNLMTHALHHIGASLYANGAQIITLVHGAARGADTLAGNIGAQLGYSIEAHPADWNTYGKKAGIIRNQHMVNLGADVTLAFPIGESRGTRHCMRVAELARIPVINVTEGANSV